MSFPEKIISQQRTISINFACKRCCQPLKLSTFKKDLHSQTLSELSLPLNLNTDREHRNALMQTFQKQCDETSVMRKITLPVKFSEASSDFMVVDEMSNLPIDSNQSLRVTAALFDIMSNQSHVDHPLCEECTDNLLDQSDQQYRNYEDECKEYRDFLDHLEMGNEDDDLEKLKVVLSELQKEETDLEAEWKKIQYKENEMKETLKKCEDELETLQREEAKRWKEYYRIKRQRLLSKDNQRSINNQLKYAQIQLEKLNEMNVFNATFHIWHDGPFGTINSLRLGKLQKHGVGWTEINAAWGQTVLLLHSLAKAINLTFKRYRLVPYGNHSYIENLGNNPKELPLYCIGGETFMLDSKFDLAMVAFLDCLQQLKEKIESGDASFHLPYAMDKGKIIDKRSNITYSIKTQLNSEEQWTKALKFMLTNLKWALAWVSTQFYESNKS